MSAAEKKVTKSTKKSDTAPGAIAATAEQAQIIIRKVVNPETKAIVVKVLKIATEQAQSLAKLGMGKIKELQNKKAANSSKTAKKS